MAAVKKSGGGVSTISEDTGVAVSSIVLVAPGAGYANRILAIFAQQVGGTSVQMIVNLQQSASAQDPVGVNVNLARVQRTAGQASNFQFVGGKGAPIIGGNNQQTSINVNGNVNDSTETDLVIVADVVKA